MEGILIIDKPKGWTSFDIIAKLRGITKIRKIGHTGTLDPNATGVLVCCISRKATRLIQFLEKDDKEYIAEIEIGKSSNTGDAEGKITEHNYDESLTKEQIEKALNKFLGEIEQIPPMYSAIKIKGKKLYELARKGIEVERKPRKITIKNIELLEVNLPFIKFSVQCSKGTYIRTLGEDIAKELKTYSYLKDLRRTKAGSYLINQAVPIKNLTIEKVEQNLISIEDFKIK